MCYDFFFFFKQKTAYEMRISDWSSDVCSSDLNPACRVGGSCVPLNIFGENAFSDAAADYVVDRGIGISVNTLQTVTANLGGTLPFGISDPIAFNIGYEHRREYGSFRPDDILKGGITLFYGTAALSETPPFTYTTPQLYASHTVPSTA